MDVDFGNLCQLSTRGLPKSAAGESFVTGIGRWSHDLERSRRWAGSPHEVLMVALNWTILRAVHAAFATRQSVVLAELPSVRERFETELRLLLKRPHWKELDSKIIREYFGE